jgi:hypothetical protein
MRRGLFVLSAVVSVLAAPGRAQRAPLPPVDSATVVRLRLNDGSEVLGRVLAWDTDSLTVETTLGLRLRIPPAALRSWRVQRGRLAGGRFLESDPNASRLFFAPTGRTLPAGDGYFADYYLFFPFLAVGATDWLTVAGGASIIPGADNQLVYAAPKLGLVRGPTVNVGVGGIYATVPGEEGSVGAVYGVATFGSEDQALTLLAGYPFVNGERTREPGVVLGAERRVAGRAKLLIEAWRLPGVNEVPAIFGMRFFGNRVSVDFGLLYVLGAETEGFPFFPWVDFVISW